MFSPCSTSRQASEAWIDELRERVREAGGTLPGKYIDTLYELIKRLRGHGLGLGRFGLLMQLPGVSTDKTFLCDSGCSERLRGVGGSRTVGIVNTLVRGVVLWRCELLRWY